VKYTSAAAFRQALDQRLKNEAATSGLSVGRLRKRVAFEMFLRRLLAVAPDRWVLKGALALDFRLAVTTRATKDIDLEREDDEQAAIHDIAAAQQLVLDDFFTFAATRTDDLDNADEFSAIRFHVTAQLAGRTFEQFLVDIAFTDAISWTPDNIQTSDVLSFADRARRPRPRAMGCCR
jgi:Nucleotidyl transferase AbiEii toxin, Type IV TA system